MPAAELTHREYISQLFGSHYTWLCERLRRQLDSRACAEDIAAQAFLQLLASPNVVPIRQPRALLTTIAQRLLYQRWRRRDLERSYLDELSVTDDSHNATPEQSVQAIETLSRIDRRLNSLPTKVKATFLLSRNNGLTYPEIAIELGISQRSVSFYMDKAQTCCQRACLE
ncbi:MAG TPA: sigma-70 family RNA polymerase sigma factor [Pseudomonas sp.]|uniref:sigma-70 family RNA polymerase sigma factor n=1 Tax=Pseudomonas sp. TaxID=306 RepID=UPI002ED8B2F0